MAIDTVARALGANAQSDIDTFKGQSVYKFKGSLLFEDLPIDPTQGDVYNILDSFTLRGQDYPAGTNLAWNGTQWEALGGVSSDVEGAIWLLTVSNAAPAQCSKGDKYFNTETNLVYEATATNTWNAIGYEPNNTLPYLALDTNRLYFWNGTTLLPAVPDNVLVYGEGEQVSDVTIPATEIGYDNTGTAITGTTVQEAITELDDRQPDLTDYVKRTDYATASVGGVVKTLGSQGVLTSGNGNLYISAASMADIDDKASQFKAIVPSTIDYAIDSRWSIITSTTDNALILANKQEARLGELASLILNMEASINSKYESYLTFRSGNTATSITYSATPIIWTGDDCYYDGSFVPEKNTNYEVDFKITGYDTNNDPIIIARVGSWN